MAIVPAGLARVSNLLRTSVANSTVARTQASLLEVQNQLSTGRRINLPSDDAGASAIVQQIRKTLEQRLAYADNIKQGINHLGEVDATLGEVGNLLQQAQTIASANVGSDVTPEQRQSAAEVIKSLYSQMLTLANKQAGGMYLFGGTRSDTAPFIEEGGGIKFVGATETLSNQYDESTTLSFMVNGAEVFGALSSRIEGTADLSPGIGVDKRLVSLHGANGEGIRSGAIRVSNGTTSAIVDLSDADTISDVIIRINAAGVGGITASIGADNRSLVLSGGVTDDITVHEVGGGKTASDLGILREVGAGPSVQLSGSDVRPKLIPTTRLSDLKSGAGIDLSSGLRITNGQMTADIRFTSPPLPTPAKVEDMLNAINNSGTAVRAEINADGTGINILNPTQGTTLTIGEIGGGTTAEDLGVRSFNAQSPLAELNFGKGVRTVDGDDFRITNSAGASVDIDITGLETVGDVLAAINTAAAGLNVTASLAADGNGIVLTDTAGGGGTLTLTPLNFSQAASDLGINKPAVGNVITGSDVNAVEASGVFSHLAKLRDALLSSDQRAITEAAEGLAADASIVTRIRGQVGARVQDLEAREERLADQNLATRSLLSSLEDVDYTEAISRFTTLQTSLQATLQSAGQMLNLSLLDFLS